MEKIHLPPTLSPVSFLAASEARVSDIFAARLHPRHLLRCCERPMEAGGVVRKYGGFCARDTPRRDRVPRSKFFPPTLLAVEHIRSVLDPRTPPASYAPASPELLGDGYLRSHCWVAAGLVCCFSSEAETPGPASTAIDWMVTLTHPISTSISRLGAPPDSYITANIRWSKGSGGRHG